MPVGMSTEAETVLELGGRSVPVRVRRSPTARRMTLRVDSARLVLLLVLPSRVPLAEGLRFARDKADWIAARLAAQPPRRPFGDGVVVPVRGVDHVIRHRPEARRGVWAEDGMLSVSGAAEHLPRRVEDWLRREAKRQLADSARVYAARLGRTVGRVSVRDPKARWGSCTARGDLSFSWRLVLAPMAVADYVVAHEVAHLVELNHSADFWRLVSLLVDDVATPRIWLRRHGATLHAFG